MLTGTLTEIRERFADGLLIESPDDSPLVRSTPCALVSRERFFRLLDVERAAAEYVEQFDNGYLGDATDALRDLRLTVRGMNIQSLAQSLLRPDDPPKQP